MLDFKGRFLASRVAFQCAQGKNRHASSGNIISSVRAPKQSATVPCLAHSRTWQGIGTMH